MDGRNSTPIEVGLGAHDLRRLEGDRRRSVISCLEGTVWITQEGDAEDHVLRRGEHFNVSQPGLVLVEAIRDAFLRVTVATHDRARN